MAVVQDLVPVRGRAHSAGGVCAFLQAVVVDRAGGYV